MIGGVLRGGRRRPFSYGMQQASGPASAAECEAHAGSDLPQSQRHQVLGGCGCTQRSR